MIICWPYWSWIILTFHFVLYDLVGLRNLIGSTVINELLSYFSVLSNYVMDNVNACAPFTDYLKLVQLQISSNMLF